MATTVRVYQETTRLYGDAPSKSTISKVVVSDAVFNNALETIGVLQRMVNDLGNHLDKLSTGDKTLYEAGLADATDLTQLVMYLMSVPLSAAKYKASRQVLVTHFGKRGPGFDKALQLAKDAKGKFQAAYEGAGGGEADDWKDIVFNDKKLKTASTTLKTGYGNLAREVNDMEFQRTISTLDTISDELMEFGGRFTGTTGNEAAWKRAKEDWPAFKKTLESRVDALTKDCEDARGPADEAKSKIEVSMAGFEGDHTAVVTNLARIASNHPPIGNVGDMDKAIQTLAPGQAPTIPCLGLMELLLRIVAQGCDSLDDFKKTLGSLESGQMDRGLISPYPAVVFACAGQNPDEPKFVITSSMDHWDWCQPLDEAVKYFRNRVRTAAQPILRDTSVDVPLRIDALSTKAANEFLVSEKKGETQNQRLARRDQLISTWRGKPAQYHNHEKEKGLPFRGPSLEEMGRCLRCQHLFAYDVGGVSLDDEERILRREKYTFNLGWLCAETYASYYCFAANH